MKLLFLVSIITSFLYYIIKSNKTLNIIQQNWYNEGNRYLNWIYNNIYKVFLEVDMFFFIFVIGLFLEPKYLMIFFVLFYGACALSFMKKRRKEQVKKPLAFTKRVIIITEMTNAMKVHIILIF